MFVGLTWVLAAAGLRNFGTGSPAIWWLVISFIVVAVVYGRRALLSLMVIAGVSLAALSWGFITQRITPSANLNDMQASFAAWINFYISIFVFLFVFYRSYALFQQALIQKSQAKFQLWVDDLALGILVIDTHRQIFYSNQRAKSLLAPVISMNAALGFSERFSLYKSGSDTHYPDDELPLNRAFRGEICSVEDIVLRHTKEYQLQMWAKPAFNEMGEIEYVVVTLDEITQRKRNEKLKSEFVSMVSHELRTPLTSIRAALGVLHSNLFKELPEKAQTLVQIANSNSERLITLVNDILDMQKIEAGRMDFEFQRICLNDLVSKTLNDLSSYALQHNVSLVFLPAPENFWVTGDATRLQQALVNLISNATKFSPIGDRVEVNLIRVDNRVKVEIIDHGPGIPNEFRGRIFQPFSQADSSATRAKGGTGLGLVISKVIIEKHHGRIGFESQLGQGTQFYFYLPLVQD